MSNFVILLLCALVAINLTISSQTELHVNETQITNYSNEQIQIDVYPVGLVFNGSKEYKLRCLHQLGNVKYIVGALNVVLPSGGIAQFNHDARDGDVPMTGAIGYGKYRIDFYSSSGNYLNYCYVDFSHSNYPWDYHPNGLQNDISITFFDANNIRGWDEPLPIDRTIKIWDQRIRGNPLALEEQNKTGFKTAMADQFWNWSIIPHYPKNFGGRGSDIGKLFVNLQVLPSHEQIIACGEVFSVENGARLELLSSNSGINFSQFLVGQTPGICDAVFINQTEGSLLLMRNTKFTVENGSKLYLEKNSNVTINNIGAEFRLKSGSYYCNRGAKILSGKLIIEKYVQYCLPDPPARIVNYFQDSASIILENGAELVIPDSTTYVFEGSETALICKDSSSIKFGKNSKLVFQDGARISADGCKFTSLDSADTWDGIYLIDNANDTLKNCTFVNAYNGININPDLAAPIVDTHTTIIQNCKFRNSTTGILLNQVYVNDADGILIDNCTTESNIATGYSTGYVLQYCASNGVVITDNTLNNCGIGITAIQSSPYIARNTITGESSSGTGIYLDNSNGTIEYNRVYNFEKSIEGSYSSPYLLKNTLSDASLQSIALTNNSVPVLRPVVSGSAVRWLGGNNRITGSPIYGAFNFSKDCYPMIDSGYNVIHVTSSDYVMAELGGDYYATLNNWYDNPPITSLFNVQGGNLYYEPIFDGTTLPTTDYFELNPLGFDMYDSVFVKNIGDNPGAGTLFMQAYTNESQGNYNTAINLYKDVITQYKNTEYAPVSLARIFNSLEKNNSSSSVYGQIQVYYAGIKTDTTHTPESREIAEDFVIKAKVKQGNVSEAITDYENIYQLNQNTPKGTHALVNKMCLENMLQGLTDDPNEPVKLNPSKAGLLAYLTRNVTSNSQSTLNNNFPTSFRLYQNYPNPFNPQTTIRFDVPKDAMVSVRIYDLLGREVYNYSGYQTAGTHEVKFDGSNFASGMYFYSVEANGFKETKKMVLLK